MEAMRSTGRYKIGVLCKALGLSRSGYHAWKRRKPSLRKLEEERIVGAINSAHERGRGNYGPEKIQTEILAIDGLDVGLNRIKRLRRKHRIRCKQKRKFKATTDSKHKMPVAPNLLNQKFEVLKPNQVWVADITYIPTYEGWLYLAAIKDLCTKEIVGYALNERMTHDLVGRALFRAVVTKKPPAAPSFRPWQSVLLQELPENHQTVPHSSINEQERKLLRQRSDGKLVWNAEIRTDTSSAL